jgi:hypothetical protein
VTEAAGKKEDSDKKSQTGSLFNFSNVATAGGANGTTLFGGSATGGSLFGAPTKTTASTAVFSSGSLFGGPGIGASTGGSLFGGASLFGNSQPAGS